MVFTESYLKCNLLAEEVRISGFTMVRNATKLHYPVAESIRSILPIVDEFVVALGEGDDDDLTRERIEAIGSDKLRIIDTVWDTEAYPNGTENAHQTDIAKEACSGDWLFYLQADELVHEDDLLRIKEACSQYLQDERVEGFLFNYVHFWGDFDRYLDAHGWYPEEIRIVRNDPDIHSWRSAQSFRRIPDFDGKDYRRVRGTYKLGVVKLDARILHYGWVRPPYKMGKKKQALHAIHQGQGKDDPEPDAFDYGDLDKLPRYTGTHPRVMREWIEATRPQLEKGGPSNPSREKHKHEKLKNRMLTWVEQNLLGGRKLFRPKNWRLIESKER